MKFGPVDVSDALGAVLAHSVALSHGGRLRKGQVLTAQNLEALRAAGHAQVSVAHLEPGDIDEDAAALALAQALVPAPDAAGLTLKPVGTGRVNILAAAPGVARIDAQKITAMNSVDPALTVATVPRWHRMDAGGMVATVKIIPYAVSGPALTHACAAGRGGLSLCRPLIRRAALIETTLDAGPPPAESKGHRVTAERLARLGVGLPPSDCVPHRPEALRDALLRVKETPLILILSASATSDSRDTGPEALRRAGGSVTHFGMPVDPGNLLFLGQLGGACVIGLPGCAKSPALNGADWVLERVICGVPVTAADIQGMGVGGLLKEIPTRPRPRDRST